MATKGVVPVVWVYAPQLVPAPLKVPPCRPQLYSLRTEQPLVRQQAPLGVAVTVMLHEPVAVVLAESVMV